MRQVEHYASIPAMKAALRSAGSHFFDAKTMKSFRSRLERGGMIRRTFFITSEQFEGFDGELGPRLYAVRYLVRHSNGTLNVNTYTVGAPNIDGIHRFETLATARAAAEAADLETLGEAEL